jgi:hypothetical protein
MSRWGIQPLDARYAATEVVGPVTKWGTAKRDAPMPGTWHFYCDDYKFASLYSHPMILPSTRPAAAVECNYSTFLPMRRWEVLAGIGRKRWLAAVWHSQGIKTFVDLNVDPAFADLALLGVPTGWNAYATRIHSETTKAEIMRQYAQAQKRSGLARPFFLVIGGGRPWRLAARHYHWSWASTVRRPPARSQTNGQR